MPRKSREEYNAYMRDYNRARAKQKKEDFDATKAVFDLEAPAKLVGKVKEATGNTEEDPVLNAIEKYSKYLPLVAEFIKGFQGAAAQQAQPQQQMPRAPIGWLEKSPMQRLAMKYNNPQWYSAGEKYEALMAGVDVDYSNTGYVDPTYNDAAERRRMARYQQTVQGNEARNLAELSKKYGEPPIVQDTPPMPVEQPKQAEKPVNEDIMNELNQDNARYVKMLTDYINTMSPEQVKQVLEGNVEEHLSKIKKYTFLIPVHVKGMIQNTTGEQFEEVVKINCPEKYAMAVEQKAEKKLGYFFEEFKKIL